ncbi:RIP metalloprotease RseP [Verminephrobacter aporrectodeae subsp. tuberculatae]|uniref:Zinc metalloprotease n=3 Tax=Verminephrobacter TaxID=364316 RepID=A0ABT3KR50_9BURK|nr:RIP metalloprotease RseP [Verminephrobacter aporrectodeae]MCW5320740.1 RIP metalloprotease RseP [Verminephrobacter aporrectodeae subsp. tuberculatae]MCW8165309.1 RIP metalloprotease RseP [Verminephrobacter aporrectodeae subsp. tuberculatae]MCW8168972.1 RIP metalloprotease RseP [Verminephrobacter aporrectodeae subsp. tuberculatae]
MLLTIAAFLVTLGLLITVHEYGHYRVAVACGVKVLRFSVGWGRPLLRWQPKGSPTEFVLAAFPLGGYVRMLDEREAPVLPQERHLAFNTRPLWARAAIVAAGPGANLLLAVLLYSTVNWIGVEEPRAVLASPVAGSVAHAAGLRGGELVERAALGADELEPVRSFTDLRWLLARGALEGVGARLEVSASRGAGHREMLLDLSGIDNGEVDSRLLHRIGVAGPWTRPVLGEILPEGAAQRAGLRQGDLVLGVGATDVVDGEQLRELIRQSVRGSEPLVQSWRIERAGQRLTIEVLAEARAQPGAVPGHIGVIGAYVGATPELVTVEYGLFEGAWAGLIRTWDISALTLRMLGRMLIGEASLKNLSGPLTIADFAGRSVSRGLTPYIGFLALLSVSLGVLNLLPLPVLDGGHLMYYLWEAVTGKGVSQAWMEWLQRAGAALLLLVMSVALFNDVTRLFG